MIVDLYVTTLNQKDVSSSSYDNLLSAWECEVWPRCHLPIINIHFGFWLRAG